VQRTDTPPDSVAESVRPPLHNYAPLHGPADLPAEAVSPAHRAEGFPSVEATETAQERLRIDPSEGSPMGQFYHPDRYPPHDQEQELLLMDLFPQEDSNPNGSDR
jgi:hypothetical protein